jgi:hypothetical protein
LAEVTISFCWEVKSWIFCLKNVGFFDKLRTNVLPIRLTPLKKGDGKRWVPKVFATAGLPKEEFWVVLLFVLVSTPVGVIGVKKLTPFFKFTTLLFLDHFLNYLVVSFLQLNDFVRTPQHQPKIINIKIKGGTYV